MRRVSWDVVRAEFGWPDRCSWSGVRAKLRTRVRVGVGVRVTNTLITNKMLESEFASQTLTLTLTLTLTPDPNPDPNPTLLAVTDSIGSLGRSLFKVDLCLGVGRGEGRAIGRLGRRTRC